MTNMLATRATTLYNLDGPLTTMYLPALPAQREQLVGVGPVARVNDANATVPLPTGRTTAQSVSRDDYSALIGD